VIDIGSSYVCGGGLSAPVKVSLSRYGRAGMSSSAVAGEATRKQGLHGARNIPETLFNTSGILPDFAVS
jgi:hypothetical protein